jgi:EmrB/QacA subfamily drug resistance transporter
MNDITADGASMRAQQEGGYPKRWLVLPVLLVGFFLLPLDFSIVNVALPSIRAGLTASGGDLQLIIAFYAVAFAVFLITGGRLGDLYGRKAMFIGGIAAFMTASLACGLAPTIHVLIAGRMIQGLAAAMTQPQVLAMIGTIFPPAERSRALGLYGATAGLGLVVGQFFGGLLISLHPFGFTWQAIFLINLPVGALDLAAAAWLLPSSQTVRSRLDLPGVAILSAGLILLVYPLVAGREAGWPAWTLLCLAASIPVLALFVLVEHGIVARGGSPLLDIRLFRGRAFSVGLALSLMVYSSSAFFFSFAVYLQSGLGWSVLSAGLGILPFGLGFFFGSLSVPMLLPRLGLRAPILGYSLGIAGHCVTVAILLDGGVPGVPMFTAMAIAGFGLGLVFPSLLRIVMQNIPASQAGMTSGALNTAIQIGPAIAVPVIGGVFFSVLGRDGSAEAYGHAFAAAIICVIATFAASLALITLLRPAR